jgi:hypothetical protein
VVRHIESNNETSFPRVRLAPTRSRLSFGLAALFAAVSAAAVIAGAAKMPARLGLLFAINAVTFTMGLYYLRQGWSLCRASESEPCDDQCAWAHVGFGLLLIAFAGLTFGVVALVNR